MRMHDGHGFTVSPLPAERHPMAGFTWNVETVTAGRWHRIATIDATNSEIAALAKYVRSLGDDFHAEREAG